MPRARETIERLAVLARDAALELAELALAWLLHQRAVTAPVIGPRNRSQLASALRALDVELDDSLLTAIDALVPPTTAALPIIG